VCSDCRAAYWNSKANTDGTLQNISAKLPQLCAISGLPLFSLASPQKRISNFWQGCQRPVTHHQVPTVLSFTFRVVERALSLSPEAFQRFANARFHHRYRKRDR